jgi:hypothetical protein
MSTTTEPAAGSTAGSPTKSRRRDDGGIVIVYFALAIFVIMGMAAFAVDLGYWYFQASRVQRAADAASLAGVVYMPGEPNEATSVADTVAADNGFSSPTDQITVAGTADPHQLTVTIKDPDVPTFFAKVFGMKNVTETRTATAEYDPSIPLGSPENSFGTGNLSLGAGSPTDIWAAINGYCTAKENGDEFASKWDGSWNGSSWDCPDEGSNNGAPNIANTEYTSAGYYYDIQIPAVVPGPPLTVQAFDPAFEGGAHPPCSGSPDNPPLVANQTITTTYTLWYAPVPLDHTQDQELASTTYDTDAAAGCNSWTNLFTPFTPLANAEYRVQVQTQANQANSDGNNSYALRVFDTPTFSRCSTETSVAWYSGSCPEIHGDTALSVYANESQTTGSFYLASIDPAYANHTMLIDLFDPGEGDQYIQIIDPDTGKPFPFTYQTIDGTTPACPYGSDCAQNLGFGGSDLDISGTSDNNASPPTTGSPGLPVYKTTAHQPADEASTSLFNDRHVQLSVQIPANYQGLNGGWWQIEYTSGGTVTDRTTWSVQILGNPIHLVQ